MMDFCMSLHPETLLAHAGTISDDASGALLHAPHFVTTFQRAGDGTYPGGYVYTRSGNPTRTLFEDTLARLEGGAACAAFSSGQAATMAILQSLPPESHVLIPESAYFGIGALLETVFSGKSLSYDRVDMTNLFIVKSKIRSETQLIWVETPSNPLCLISDINALAQLAHQNNALLVVDNTLATPLLQNPLKHGADLVMHSVTKYLSGHSDVLAGAVVAKDEALLSGIRQIQTLGGAVMDPFSAWLAMRGMRSLGARMRVHQESAHHVATFLAGHHRVKCVHYPGITSADVQTLISRQMSGYGGLFSFEVFGTAQDALAVTDRVKVFTRATSLGGTESLIEHRHSVEKPPTTTPPTLLRCAIGLEHPDDLIADLAQALAG